MHVCNRTTETLALGTLDHFSQTKRSCCTVLHPKANRFLVSSILASCNERISDYIDDYFCVFKRYQIDLGGNRKRKAIDRDRERERQRVNGAKFNRYALIISTDNECNFIAVNI